jgi:hypothetical protein
MISLYSHTFYDLSRFSRCIFGPQGASSWANRSQNSTSFSFYMEKFYVICKLLFLHKTELLKVTQNHYLKNIFYSKEKNSSEKTRKVQMSIIGIIYKLIEINPHNQIILSNKMEWTADTTNYADESKNPFAK